MHPDEPRSDTVTALKEYPLYTQASEAHAAGDTETAKSLFDEHLSQIPDHSEAWNDLGALMYEQGDVEESIRLFGHAVAADPNNSTAFENLIDAYTSAEKYAEAVLLATRWSEYAPGSPAPWIALARLNLMAGNIEAARDALTRAHSVAPEEACVAEALSHLNSHQCSQIVGTDVSHIPEGTF